MTRQSSSSSSGRPSSLLSNQFKDSYKLIDGQALGPVTSLYEYTRQGWRLDQVVDEDESFNLVDANTLIKTENDDGITETYTYTDLRNGVSDGIYSLSSKSEDLITQYNFRESQTNFGVPFDDSRQFVLSGSTVVGAKEFDDNRWEIERIGRNKTFTYDADSNTFNMIETRRTGVETTVFGDTNGDNIFNPIRETFVANIV